MALPDARQRIKIVDIVPIEYKDFLQYCHESNIEFLDQITDLEYLEYRYKFQRNKIEIDKLKTLLKNSIDRRNNIVKNLLQSSIDKKSEKSLFAFFDEHKVKYVDNRDKGGYLWVKGGRKLKNIITYCRTNFGLRFQYKKDGSSKLGRSPMWCTKKYANSAEQLIERQRTNGRDFKEKVPKVHTPQKYIRQLEELLASRYKYGFRIGSPIEIMRLRSCAEEKKINLPEDDNKLRRDICAVGMTIDDKVYVIREEVLLELSNMLDNVFLSGVGGVFLESFYDKNSMWMREHYIASVEILRKILEQRHHDYYFGQNIVVRGKKKNEIEVTIEEINRVSEDNRIISIDELEKQLEYIPSEKISVALSSMPDAIRISTGKYFRMQYFIIGKDDSMAISRFVAEECSTNGYVSITDIPMGNIPIENYELSVQALYIAIYNAVLKGDYNLNGKILTTVKNDIDVRKLLKKFCTGRKECTVTEVMNRAKELTNNSNKQYSMIALYDTMVRIDVDRFISEDELHFDVDRIDKLLAGIIDGRFIPIKKITTFALFPTCGSSWNHYLLESYCYRFSKKFRLAVLTYNDKNIGLIVEKKTTLAYTDMLSEIAAAANIELVSETVGKYFVDNGLTGKKKFASLVDIVEKARIIRGEC